MKLTINNIKLQPDEPEVNIKLKILKKFNINTDIQYSIIRKSLDARKKKDIFYNYKVVIDIPDNFAEILLLHNDVSEYYEKIFSSSVKNLKGHRVTIIGTGPTGLFCALRLIERGAFVELFERGKPVDERMKDISMLEETGKLNINSNVLFGEGGAGTYSDGKLITRTNRLESTWSDKKLIEFGAPESIIYEAKPHLGTDAVRKIIKNIRDFILDSGSKIYFNECVEDIIFKDNYVSAIITSAGKEYSCSKLILASGHSARDIYYLLKRKGVFLEKKGFAVGVRMEHPAEHINSIQFGNSKYKDVLPTAEYFLTSKNEKTGRGTYSFCMCPGGIVVNSSSENESLCTNGMSYSKRDMPYSNAALVVTVLEKDLGHDVLSGIEFQQTIERAAYKAGNGNFSSPAQRVTSFINKRIDDNLPVSSYKNGIVSSNLSLYLPEWIVSEIEYSLFKFENKMKGLISSEGIFIGAETRTSSPVRILRGDDFQSVSHKGLYPAGEGAGYSGGIVSSAVDGIRIADSILSVN